MRASAVVEVVRALAEAGVEVWLDGGWGVDALLGEQTREHSDLDLIVDVATADAIRTRLAELGFERGEQEGDNFVLVHAENGRVDAHGVHFDERGYGEFRFEGGSWPFPPSAFAGEGTIAGCEVRCLSPEAQVQCHAQGYEPTPKDLADMARLQERFGVVLPLSLSSCASSPVSNGRKRP